MQSFFSSILWVVGNAKLVLNKWVDFVVKGGNSLRKNIILLQLYGVALGGTICIVGNAKLVLNIYVRVKSLPPVLYGK